MRERLMVVMLLLLVLMMLAMLIILAVLIMRRLVLLIWEGRMRSALAVGYAGGVYRLLRVLLVHGFVKLFAARCS
jgi:hypothetical protein